MNPVPRETARESAQWCWRDVTEEKNWKLTTGFGKRGSYQWPSQEREAQKPDGNGLRRKRGQESPGGIRNDFLIRCRRKLIKEVTREGNKVYGDETVFPLDPFYFFRTARPGRQSCTTTTI